MPKLSKEDNLYNFWQEIVSRVKAVKSLDSEIKVSLDIGGVLYDNILTKSLKVEDGEVYIELTSKLRLSIFKKTEYELYFDKFYDGVWSTFTVASEEFAKVFKFYKEIQFRDL